MFTYEIQHRTNLALFVIRKDDGTPESARNPESVGSLYLEANQEPIIEKLIKELNEYNSPAERRKREGIQTITG